MRQLFIIKITPNLLILTTKLWVLSRTTISIFFLFTSGGKVSGIFSSSMGSYRSFSASISISTDNSVVYVLNASNSDMRSPQNTFHWIVKVDQLEIFRRLSAILHQTYPGWKYKHKGDHFKVRLKTRLIGLVPLVNVFIIILNWLSRSDKIYFRKLFWLKCIKIRCLVIVW